MPVRRFPRHPVAVDPVLERVLRRGVLLGLAIVLLLPAARGHSAWLGWMPLWLLCMPLTGWWALHRFRLRWPHALRLGSGLRERRSAGVQARRLGPVPRIRFARNGSAKPPRGVRRDGRAYAWGHGRPGAWV